LDEKLADMPHWTLHDLRRTARLLMAEAGVAENVAERVLGHALPGPPVPERRDESKFCDVFHYWS
jgi:integrase